MDLFLDIENRCEEQLALVGLGVGDSFPLNYSHDDGECVWDRDFSDEF